MATITIPALSEMGKDRVEALIAQLLRSRLHLFSEADRAGIARVLLSRNPASRAELEEWVGRYARIADRGRSPVILTQAPELTRLVTEPPEIPNKASMRAALRRSLERVQGASTAFCAWGEVGLLNQIEPDDPFDSAEPAHWFSSLVSLLYKVVFDAGDPGLLFMCRFRYEAECNDLVEARRPAFLEDLRVLRVSMQHGMDLTRITDKATVDHVRQWYVQMCGAANPRTHHWRFLTFRLLVEWGRFTKSIADAAKRLGFCRSSLVIRWQWQHRARAVSGETVRAILAAVLAEANLSIDAARAVDRYRQPLIDELERLNTRPGAVLEEARRIAALWVLEGSVRV